jgi:hypothetical protein
VILTAVILYSIHLPILGLENPSFFLEAFEIDIKIVFTLAMLLCVPLAVVGLGVVHMAIEEPAS